MSEAWRTSEAERRGEGGEASLTSHIAEAACHKPCFRKPGLCGVHCPLTLSWSRCGGVIRLRNEH